jgi:DNA-binding transcriptional LysR family regulator
MELRRLRTFVTVAELGTVSKAAVRLRITQPALSRQIIDLQDELRLRLFDRVGRGLVLTAEGEQFLGYCRGVLAHIDALGERADVLRRGDTGVLKVAAPPHTIESVLAAFLPRYAERFPNVHVKLTEALGREQTAMLERGEVHIGIRHDQGDRRFESRILPPDEVLGAMLARSISHSSRPIRCCCSIRAIRSAACSTQLAASRMSNPIFGSRAAHPTPCSRSRRRGKGSRSFPRCCGPIATHCASCA